MVRSRSAPVAAQPVAEEIEFRQIPNPASAHFAEMARPTRIEPAFSPVFEPETEIESRLADVSPPAADEPEVEPFQSPQEETEAPAFIEAEDQPQPVEAEAEAEAAAEGDTAAKVNDLEREMARLLGEISTRRSS
jgi:hypothetical protein